MSLASLLIVEDESLIAHDLAEFLKECGYAIAGIAEDASTAIRLAEEDRPDLALVDVNLAHGDSGLEVASTLRDRLQIPSILVTAHLQDAQAVQERAFGFIQKPFRHEQVAETVEAGLRWLREGQAEAPPATLIPTRKPPVREEPRALGRVLIVDDELAYLEFIARCLHGAGHVVRGTASGAEAVRLYEPGMFEAAILDIFMPEQDGLETMRALRARDPELRIVAMADPNEGGPLDFLRYARALGAHATLEKPFPCPALLETLARVIP